MNRIKKIDNLIVFHLIMIYSDDSVDSYRFGVNRGYFNEKFEACFGDKLTYNYDYVKYCFEVKRDLNDLDDGWIKKLEACFFKFYTQEDFDNIKSENSDHLLHQSIIRKKLTQIKETRCYKILGLL